MTHQSNRITNQSNKDVFFRSRVVFACHQRVDFLFILFTCLGVRDGHTADMEEYQLAKDVPLQQKQLGWGRRPLSGNLYGPNWLDDEKRKMIKRMYQKGEKDKHAKMRPEEMREEIKRDFPGMFSIPTAETIKSYINSLNNAKKKKDDGNNDEVDTGGEAVDVANNDGVVPRKIVDRIKIRLSEDMTLAPRKLIVELQKEFAVNGNLPHDWPDKKKLSAKISTVKSTMKKKTQTNDLDFDRIIFDT